jgi:hypothetical protein
MAFSRFTLKQVKVELGLTLEETTSLFPAAQPAPLSEYLHTTLGEFVPIALASNTEKARSEWIIAPFLADLRRQYKAQLSLFSGISWSVDPAKGLEGACDFLLSATPEQLYLTAPVMAVVEAKKEDVIGGLGQCLATMYAAIAFNAAEDNSIATIYGAVTTGEIWRFLKLEATSQTAFIDADQYYLQQPELLMGVLKHIVQSVLENHATPSES